MPWTLDEDSGIWKWLAELIYAHLIPMNQAVAKRADNTDYRLLLSLRNPRASINAIVSTIKGNASLFTDLIKPTCTRKGSMHTLRDRFHLEDDDLPYYSTYICSIRGKLCAHLWRVKTLIYKPQCAMFRIMTFFSSLRAYLFLVHLVCVMERNGDQGFREQRINYALRKELCML